MKILYFIRGLNVGGAETFIFNTLKNINKQQFHIDFVLQNTQNNNARLISLCSDIGCKIYYITPFEKGYFKSIAELTKILKIGHYEMIHIHANALINMVPVISASKCGVRIALHSHNTHNNQGGLLGTLIHKFNRWYLRKQKILRLACGVEAGNWMHGNQPYIILNNAVNLDEYKYDAVFRKEIRQQLNAEDSFVIGNISRFVKAKNHTFILDVFQEVLRRRANSKLVLLGDGPLFDNIFAKAHQLGLQKNVIFVGAIEQVNKYYSAFDCLLFPSIFEGLPFTLVEAQVSGLEIFASTNITTEVNVTGAIEYLDLSKNAEYWAEHIMNADQEKDRSEAYYQMRGSIFDEQTEIKKLQDIYLNWE